MQKLKREDEVIVIAGKDKGKRGKITRIMGDGRLIISGINMMKRHTKPNPNMGRQGGIIEKEAGIQASNVAIFNPKTEKADWSSSRGRASRPGSCAHRVQRRPDGRIKTAADHPRAVWDGPPTGRIP